MNETMSYNTPYDPRESVVLSPRPTLELRRGGSSRHSNSTLTLSAAWASLPNPCKIFLALCVFQAFTMGSFASIELVKEGTTNLQDLVLLLVSSVMFLCIVVDAFWHENAYQLLVSMASGGLNLAQLVIYSTSLSAGRDSVSITVACVCALLQLILLGLTRWAYLGFGWRMYSKLAGDMRRPNIERTRNASLRRDRFLALAKIDIQLMVLLLIVGIINGINAGGSTYLPSLLVASTVGMTAAGVWLGVCWLAVTHGRPRLSLFAEFTHPFIYIVAASYMFSSVYYGDKLVQIHGQAYLLAFPVLFLIGRTLVWWDARLLSGSDLAIMHRDLYGKLPEGGHGRLDKLTMNMANKDKETTLPTNNSSSSPVRVPSALVPLIRGSWLLKMPSQEGISFGKSSGKFNNDNNKNKNRFLLLNALLSTFGFGRSGRWRFFQLSHDGSTLRWDWRKYVLLMHVESVHACVEDLTITLKFTLEPDLRLRCKDKETHADWARGLTLVVMMLGNPDGLEGNGATRVDSATATTAAKQPPSPPKLLNRLTSGSLRASAAGLVTKDALRLAAFQARKAFSDQSENSLSDDEDDPEHGECMSKLKDDGAYKESRIDGRDGVVTPTGRHTISLHAHAGAVVQRRRGSGQVGGLPGSHASTRSPFSPQISDLMRSESARVADIEMGLRGSPQARSASFTGESPTKRISLSMRRHENILFQDHLGRRSSFSKGNPHVFLNSAITTQAAVASTLPSPLRRGTTVQDLIYEHEKDDGKLEETLEATPERSQQSYASQRSDSQCSVSSQSQGSPSPSHNSQSLALTRSVSINVEMIDFNGLSFGKMLGQGAEGPVYAAWYHETPVAVKRATCQTEIDVHLHAGWHDNVVNLRGLAHNGGHCYLVMELCPRGTLDMLIHKGALSASSTIDPTKLLPIARAIARGMLHLHCRLPPIFHRDLKPANIFIGHGFVMKIGDFGMARYAVERHSTLPASGTNYNGRLDRTLTPGVIGTAAYSAPEVLSPTTPRAGSPQQDPTIMLKADVYSFGVILWELLSRKRPFADMDGFQIQTQWVLDPESMRFSALEVPEGLDAPGRKAWKLLSNLSVQCTSWDPQERPDFSAIVGLINEALGGGGSPMKKNSKLLSPF